VKNWKVLENRCTGNRTGGLNPFPFSDHPKPANEYHLKTGQRERRSGTLTPAEASSASNDLPRSFERIRRPRSSLGAYDFIGKPLDFDELHVTIKNAGAQWRSVFA
jgi:hypothetical protein